ncbi:Platelet-activating factor acetylhydrolase [Dinochytrium kinnereticum]|nr:Platelet-activating factor acetylhydrolase [Dinochytrium kinnereticum]
MGITTDTTDTTTTTHTSDPSDQMLLEDSVPPAPVSAMGEPDPAHPLLPDDPDTTSSTTSSVSSLQASTTLSSSPRPSTASSKKIKKGSHALPSYPGPYNVGVCHVELEKSEEMKEGLLAAVFYPCEVVGRGERARWLPGPDKFYVMGYGDFVQAPRFLSKTILNAVLKNVKMPAFLNAPLISPSSASELPHQLPVVIFSHGLAGMRTTYSSFVGGLASRGFVVVAVEHRDGSASATAFNNYTTPVTYINPHPSQMLPNETNDTYLKRLRKTQLQQRHNEILSAYTFIQSLQTSGKAPNPLAVPFLPEFLGRLDLENVVMAGHSFGGATALKVLQEDVGKFRAGVVLDPWMFAVDRERGVKVPVLSVQAQFFHWRDNIQSYRTLIDTSPPAPQTTFALVLSTKHQDVSDFPSLSPRLMKLMKVAGEASPTDVKDSYDKIVGGWLGIVLEGRSGVAAGLREGCLCGDVEDRAMDGEEWGMGVSLKGEGGGKERVIFGEEAWERLLKDIPETWQEFKSICKPKEPEVWETPRRLALSGGDERFGLTNEYKAFTT